MTRAPDGRQSRRAGVPPPRRVADAVIAPSRAVDGPVYLTYRYAVGDILLEMFVVPTYSGSWAGRVRGSSSAGARTDHGARHSEEEAPAGAAGVVGCGRSVRLDDGARGGAA